ncbi:UDP-N-acetylglucosamine 1-carboxyvinyltransferase [Candidatus Collierbacteria bacterium]|nr:UDP-N-acetylglucosamine 1-carboxyvinyltransferase [Candidatus Collierbacteria bacterium]
MVETIKVTGGRRLKGEVTPIANKNAMLAVIPAAVLSSKTIVYKNVPKTSDIQKLCAIIQKLGGEVTDSVTGELKINCKNLDSYHVDEELGGSFRASLNFVGPLLARFGIAEVPLPGGCDLGMRSIEAHTNVFQKAGVEVERMGRYVRFRAPRVKAKKYTVWQIEASVTATENFVMYAAGIKSEVELFDAASEPHVTDLLNLLSEMGANISGIGSNRLIVKGKKTLGKGVFVPRPDSIDIAGYIVAAAVTNGEIKIKGANIPDIVDGMINWYSMFNIVASRKGKDLIVKRGKKGLIIDVNKSGFPLAAPNLPKFTPRPWPGFPVDALPPIAVLASKSTGRLLIQNWMYESGLDFVRELNAMGADIFMIDTQRIIINGPVTFRGGEVTPPSVIQSVKAVFLAALVDPAVTIIHGTEILKRRYPNIIEVYKKLGAKIEVVSGVMSKVK